MFHVSGVTWFNVTCQVANWLPICCQFDAYWSSIGGILVAYWLPIGCMCVSYCSPMGCGLVFYWLQWRLRVASRPTREKKNNTTAYSTSPLPPPTLINDQVHVQNFQFFFEYKKKQNMKQMKTRRFKHSLRIVFAVAHGMVHRRVTMCVAHHATHTMRSAPFVVRHASCVVRNAPCVRPRASRTMLRTQCSMRHATCVMRTASYAIFHGM